MADEVSRAIEVFEECDTSAVSDALDAHGADGGGVVTGLAPAHPDHATVGLARPLRFERVPAGEETNFPYAMLERMTEGEVFVVDGSADPGVSCWGGMASRLAAAEGMAGVIVNGGYRDVPDVRDGSFPVFGATPTPKTGQRRMRVASTDEPVTVDGVRVAPGDLVVADATGVVVVAADEAGGVADAAADVLDEERAVGEKIDAGATVTDLESEGREF